MHIELKWFSCPECDFKDPNGESQRAHEEALWWKNPQIVNCKGGKHDNIMCNESVLNL